MSLTDDQLLQAWKESVRESQSGHGYPDDPLEVTLRRFLGLVAEAQPAPQPDRTPAAVEPSCLTCGTHCGHADIIRCGTAGFGWTPLHAKPIERDCESCLHWKVPHWQPPCVTCYDPDTRACTTRNYEPMPRSEAA